MVSGLDRCDQALEGRRSKAQGEALRTLGWCGLGAVILRLRDHSYRPSFARDDRAFLRKSLQLEDLVDKPARRHADGQLFTGVESI